MTCEMMGRLFTRTLLGLCCMRAQYVMDLPIWFPLTPLNRSAQADACVDGTVKRGGSSGDYFLCHGGAWLHVVPMFDPNSADGYGPNQPRQPLCVRFSGPVHVPDGRTSAR